MTAATDPHDTMRARFAWWLLLLFGWLGAHRLYLGQRQAALALPSLVALGVAGLPTGIGIGLLLVAGLRVFTDLFRLPGMIAADRDRRRDRLGT